MKKRDLLYHETNDVAFNEVFLNVRLPALVWNRTYLIPKRAAFNHEEEELQRNGCEARKKRERRITLKETKKRIDAGILDFLQCSEGRDFTVDPTVGNDIILFTGAFEQSAVKRGRKTDARDEKSLPAQCKRILGTDERALILRGIYVHAGSRFNVEIKIHIRTNLFIISFIASPQKEKQSLLELKNQNDFDFYTKGFWEEFSRRMMPSFSTRRFFAGPASRGVFADSRGIILSSYSIAESRLVHSTFDSKVEWASPIIEHVAPMLTPSGQSGCSATYLLDRRAVSLTTFGSQSLSQLSETSLPLTFAMCVHGELLAKQPESWARLMGYVLTRSHTITTMRLAALLDLKLLREASIEMAKFDELKMRARKSISRYVEKETWGSRTRYDVDAMSSHLAKINSDFLNKNAAGIGLTFRIEASKFYIAEFKKNVVALGLSQIEGYQSYSQMIEGNIGITFEFIDRLGVRYDRMLAEYNAIIQDFTAAQTRHARDLFIDIQFKGELILIGVLVPYYLIGILAHILGEDSPLLHERLGQMTFASIWGFLGCLALFRALASKYKTKLLASLRAKIACAIAVATLGFSFLFLCNWVLKETHRPGEPAHLVVHPAQTP